MLLLAVLPFFFSNTPPASSQPQTATAAYNEVTTSNIQTIAPVVNITQNSSTEPKPSTEPQPAPSPTVQTQITIQAQPNPVTLGNNVTFFAQISPTPPTPNDHFTNLTLVIHRPDGTVDLWGPLPSNPNGTQTISYKPEMIGTYTAKAVYTGQSFDSQNITYLGAESQTTQFNVQTEIPTAPKVPGTWIVDDDGPADFHTIQEAIDAAAPGDTIYVHSGTYVENIIIYKPLTIIAENSPNTKLIAKNPGKTVLVTASRVTIFGFNIQGQGATPPTSFGIYFTNALYACNISFNTLTNHGCAISISGNSHNVTFNTITNSGVSGIYLNATSNNLIKGNTVTNSQMTGIFLAYFSTRNTLRDNNMTGNNLNIHIIGYDVQSFINDIDTSNTVNGKPVYYWINKTNQTVPTDAGAAYLINCTNITVQDLQINHNGQGVLLAHTNGSTVQRNNIANCDNGIRIQYAANNLVNENNLNACSGGIALMNATKNTITANTVTACTLNGIWVFLSSQNQFYQNNLANKNQSQVDNLMVWNNTWDNGREGNYWNDYAGTDSNDDGIGDAPYVIDSNNADHYPLMTPTTNPT